MRRALAAAASSLAALAAAPATASAKDPGRWIVTGATSVPNDYFQGLTSNPADTLGLLHGLLPGPLEDHPEAAAGRPACRWPIPPAVAAAEGYNHIGDPTWDRAEGGRVILPLECYSPRPGQHLRHRRVRRGRPGHARLPLLREARSGRDPEGDVGRGLARREADLDEQRERPARLPHERREGGERGARRTRRSSAARRLAGAVPPSGITGAVFVGGQAAPGGRGRAATRSGPSTRRPAGAGSSSRPRCAARPRASTRSPRSAATLHWLLSPIDDCQLTYPPSSALVHFVAQAGQGAAAGEGGRLDATRLPGALAVRRVV